MGYILLWEHFEDERLVKRGKGFSHLLESIVTLISLESGKCFPFGR